MISQPCFSSQQCHVRHLLLVATSVLAVIVFHGPKFNGVLHQSSMGCYINEDRRKLKMCWETHRSKVTGYFMCMLMSWMLRTLLTDDVKYLVLPAVQDASSILSTCLDFIVWLLPTKSIPMKVSHWSADSSSSLAHLSREPGLSQWFYLSSCTFLSSGVCAAELEIIFCISRQMEKP